MTRTVFNPTVRVLSQGEALDLRLLLPDVPADEGRTRYSIDDESVASLDDRGRLQTLSVGTTRVDAITESARWSTLVTVAPIVPPGGRDASPLSSRSVSPSVATLSITSGTSLVEVGQQVRFEAVARDSRGNVLPNAIITWSSSAPGVISMSSSGLLTALGPGEALVIAQAGFVTRAVRVTSEAVRVRTVRVSPASVNVTIGESVQMTATPLNLSGQPVALPPGVRCTFTSSEQGVLRASVDGLLFAIMAGASTVTANCVGVVGSVAGTVADLPTGTQPPGTQPPGTQPPGSPGPIPPAPPTVPQPPVGPSADPAALVATAGQKKNVSAYEGLAVPGRPSGWSYADPVTNRRVWKLTSSSTPESNTSAVHEYSEGPLQIGGPWSDGSYTVMLQTISGATWLVDFRFGEGLSNWRRLPSSLIMATFGRVRGSARLAYGVTHNGQLRRFDVGSMNFIDGGGFPAAFPLSASGRWLQNDATDQVFAGMGSAANSVLVLDVRTGQLRTRVVPGIDEAYLDRDGGFVMFRLASAGTATIWNLQTDATTVLTLPDQNTSGFVHPPTLRGGWIFNDVERGGGVIPTWTLFPGGGGWQRGASLNGYYPAFHGSGQWLQTNTELGGNLRRQWWVRSTYNWWGIWSTAVGLDEGISFVRADGSEERLLAHHYSIEPTRGAHNYYSQPRSTVSGDGRLVMFTSNMNNQPRTDVFLVEVPSR